jgi:hypothetical protein
LAQQCGQWHEHLLAVLAEHDGADRARGVHRLETGGDHDVVAEQEREFGRPLRRGRRGRHGDVQQGLPHGFRQVADELRHGFRRHLDARLTDDHLRDARVQRHPERRAGVAQRGQPGRTDRQPGGHDLGDEARRGDLAVRQLVFPRRHRKAAADHVAVAAGAEAAPADTAFVAVDVHPGADGGESAVRGDDVDLEVHRQAVQPRHGGSAGVAEVRHGEPDGLQPGTTGRGPQCGQPVPHRDEQAGVTVRGGRRQHENAAGHPRDGAEHVGGTGYLVSAPDQGVRPAPFDDELTTPFAARGR